ncbi:MAG: type III-B CRISPR module RAMP protein Cmr6 [Victivallales bacterium]
MMLQKTFTREAERLLSPQLDRLESASLRLSKYTFIGDNSKKDQINAVCNLSKRNPITPKAFSGDICFSMKLGGRLMANMAGGILENSGLCLHPFFNYPMIPGSALKGLAGHVAWTDWKDNLASGNIDKAKEIAEEIVSVFGSPTGNKDLDKFIKENIPSSSKEKAGSIAFLPATPANNDWHLVPDILTPHGGNDYENPKPSFFIAVEKGTEFKFSLRKTPRANDNDMHLAGKWLKTGLTEYGIGAKTVAGYGFFLSDSDKIEDCITLKLTSPGFFGGADHGKKEDTLLRVPSLRGMLRWWWRTLYRDIISEQEMKNLEDVLWGSTSTGKSLISIKITSHQNLKQELFNYKDGFNPTFEFKRKHNLMDGRPQGLFYLSYGMDEGDRKRYFLDSGAIWKLEISARKGKSKLSEGDIRNQTLASLSLLCRFGGMGSKSRKGFGSILWENAWTLEKCRQEAKSFCLINGIKPRENSVPYSWKTAILSEIQTPWKNPWAVIDRLGFAVQSFAQSYKHEECKAVLGLPRKIHGPGREPMNHQRGQHQPPQDLSPLLREANNGKKTRFASPVWYHVEPNETGSLIRITAFPSDMIRNIDTSRGIYEELIDHVTEKLKEYAEAPQSTTSHTTATPQRPHQGRQTFQPSTSCGYKAGSKVKAILLEEKTKKGGWKAKLEGTDISGPIQNSDKVPSTCAPGQQVELILKIAKGADSAFAWPVEKK